MSAPTTAVGICNLTMDLLGQEAITSITPGTTPHEAIMARAYDTERRSLLRSYLFNWAKRRKVCPKAGFTPEFDFTDAYEIPKDCLRILNFGSQASSNGTLAQQRIQAYDIEDNPAGGTVLLVNNGGGNSIALRYIADMTDVSKFDAHFIKVLALHIGVSVGYQITKSNDAVTRLNGLLEKELPLLISISGQENPPTRIEDSKFIESRRIGNTAGVAGQYTTFHTWD